MNYFAHTANDTAGRPLPVTSGAWQPLAEGLRKVGKLTGPSGSSIRIGCEAELIGLPPQLGKYSDEFQFYLRDNRDTSTEVHHVIYGAAWAFAKEQIACPFVVAGHYAGTAWPQRE